MLKTLCLGTLLLSTLPSFAGEIANITLDNGAKVRLNDDFTWEYVILEPQPQKSANMQTELPTLNAAAIAQAKLMSSTARDGIKVSFNNGQWNDDKLGLNFELQSSTSKNVVMVEVEAALYADDGKLLKTESFKVWQAKYRLPETYLRKGEKRPSRTIWIEDIPHESWKKQLLSLKVTEVKSR